MLAIKTAAPALTGHRSDHDMSASSVVLEDIFRLHPDALFGVMEKKAGSKFIDMCQNTYPGSSCQQETGVCYLVGQLNYNGVAFLFIVQVCGAAMLTALFSKMVA